jgi:hypothetical protein
MKRDFKVTVKGKKGEGFIFEGEDCETIKFMKVRLGLTNTVKETLDCDSYTLEKKKRNKF